MWLDHTHKETLGPGMWETAVAFLERAKQDPNTLLRVQDQERRRWIWEAERDELSLEKKALEVGY